MATPLPDLLAGAARLNAPDQPFAFVVEGDRIVGRWLIQHVAFASIAGVDGVDDSYTIAVIPTADGEYRLEETRVRHEGGVGAKDGTISLGGSTSTFKGKQWGFSKGASVGPNVSDRGPGVAYSWSFETRLIKDPLLGYLAANGWSERKGFLGRLFG